MTKIYLYIVISVLFVGGWSTTPYSQEIDIDNDKRPIIFVRDSKLKGHNDSFISTQTSKLALSTILKNGVYKFVINHNRDEISSKQTIHELLLYITKKSEDEYFINFEIREFDSGNLIRDAWAKKIERRHLLLQIKLSLIELFYGKSYVLRNFKKALASINKTRKKNRPTISANKKNNISTLSSLAVVSRPKKSLSTSTKRRRNVKKKNFLMRKAEIKAAQKQLNELDSLKSSLKNNLKKNNPNSKKNKKHRQSIGSGKRKSNKGVIDKEDGEEKGKEKDKKDVESEIVDSDLDNKYENEGFSKGMRPRENRTFVETVFLNRFSTSSYLITAQNNFVFYGGKTNFRTPLSLEVGDDFVLSAMYLKSFTKKDEKEIPSVKNLHLLYLKTFKYLPFDINLGLHYENNFFINLPELNSGLSVSENRLIWVQVGVERVFNFWNKMLIISASMSKNVYATSDFLENINVQLEATKTDAQIDFGFHRNWRIGVRYMKDEITSPTLKDFNITQTSLFLNISYVFREEEFKK